MGTRWKLSSWFCIEFLLAPLLLWNVIVHWFSKAPSFSDWNYPLSVKKKLGSTGHRSIVSETKVLRTFCTRSEHFMKTIFKSLIQPHIDYCSQLWMPQQGQKFEKLERVLKSWTSRIPEVRNLNYWERLDNWRCTQNRGVLSATEFSWKVLQG